jgi:hypothetical protein
MRRAEHFVNMLGTLVKHLQGRLKNADRTVLETPLAFLQRLFQAVHLPTKVRQI